MKINLCSLCGQLLNYFMYDFKTEYAHNNMLFNDGSCKNTGKNYGSAMNYIYGFIPGWAK